MFKIINSYSNFFIIFPLEFLLFINSFSIANIVLKTIKNLLLLLINSYGDGLGNR